MFWIAFCKQVLFQLYYLPICSSIQKYIDGGYHDSVLMVRMGGEDDEDNNLDSVEKYDAERDVWVELEDEGATLRMCRSGNAAAVL